MAKAKQGKIIAVDNKDRKFGANERYYAIRIEDRKKQEKCLLFTGHQLTVAKDRAAKNLEDIPKKSFWSNFFN